MYKYKNMILLLVIIISMIILYKELFNFFIYLKNTVISINNGKKYKSVVYFIALPLSISFYFDYKSTINYDMLSTICTTVSLIVGSILSMLAILSSNKEKIYNAKENNSKRISEIDYIYKGLRDIIMLETLIGVTLLILVTLYSNKQVVNILIIYLFTLFSENMLLIISDFYRLYK